MRTLAVLDATKGVSMSRWSTHVGRWAAGLALGVGLIAGPGNSSAVERLAASYSAVSGAFVGAWMAKDGGFLEKHGLQVELVYIAAAPKATQAALAGDVPIGFWGGTAVVLGRLGGADTVIVASVVDTVIFSLLTLPQIRRPEDLRGKTIAVSRFGSSSDFSTRVALKRWGLEPMKDVMLLQSGGHPESLAAMQQGHVQGATISSPTTIRARRLGYHELIDLGKLGIQYHHTSLNTTESYIARKPDTVRRFVRAYVEAVHRTRVDRELTTKIVASYARTTDPEILNEVLDVWLRYSKEIPYPSPEGLKTILDEIAPRNPKARTLKPEDMVRPTFIREMEEQGVFRALYRR